MTTGGLDALEEGSIGMLTIEVIVGASSEGVVEAAVFMDTVASVSDVSSWRGDLRIGTVVALIVECLRFLDGRGSLEGREPVIVGLLRVRRVVEVTLAVGWLGRPDLIVVVVLVVGLVLIFIAY